MKKFFTFVLSIILIFPCLFLFSACEDDKTLTGIAFYSNENKIENNETFNYDYGEEISVLDSTLSVKAIYSNNTISTLSPSEFSYAIVYSNSGDFSDATTTQTLPTSTSTGHYKITASYKNFAVSIFIIISENFIEPEYFATINKANNETIYFGDNFNLFNFNLNTTEGSADTSTLANLTYYIVSAASFANVPENETNKAKYILDNSNYSAANSISSLDAGDYYVFASFTSSGKTIYSSITDSSKFTICKKVIPFAEPTFAATTYDGNEHTLTINNIDYYTIVSGGLTNTNGGTYTTIIQPASQNYVVNFDSVSLNSFITGNITNLTANETTGEISITWKIDKAEHTEGLCLSEYFDMRTNGEINTSVIPYSFNETYVYYRVALYSEYNKNTFLNSYANSSFKISLLNNTADALLVNDITNTTGSTEIDVENINSIFIAVPLENFYDGMTINYKIAVAENNNYFNAEFSRELTLKNINAEFTSSNIAVSAGTTLESISSSLCNLEGVEYIWYQLDEYGEADYNQGALDLSTAITENVSYALCLSMYYWVFDDDQLYETLYEILDDSYIGIFNIEVYSQDSLLSMQTYSYSNDENSYQLSKVGKNIIYLTSNGESYYYKFIENPTNPSASYYEIYLADTNNNPIGNKIGIYSQGQLSHFISLFLDEFYNNNGEVIA